MLYAIIDIGSNTIRMAIYDISKDKNGEYVDMLYKDKQMVGLAGFVDDGIMIQSGIDKVCSVLKDFKEFLDKLGIDNVTAFTTAALRNCKNSKEAVAEIIRCSGIEVMVVPGDEEAELDFIGITHGRLSATGILVDIGGGSTELVHFNDGHIMNKVSLPIGSLKYRKKYVKGLFPTQDEIEIMRCRTRAVLEELAGDFLDVKFPELRCIGGTIKGAWAIYQNIIKCKFKQEGSFEVEYIGKIFDRFSKGNMTEENALILLKSIPERLETVLPGMIIADVLAEIFGASRITYSDTGMREGFIYREILPNLA